MRHWSFPAVSEHSNEWADHYHASGMCQYAHTTSGKHVTLYECHLSIDNSTQEQQGENKSVWLFKIARHHSFSKRTGDVWKHDCLRPLENWKIQTDF